MHSLHLQTLMNTQAQKRTKRTYPDHIRLAPLPIAGLSTVSRGFAFSLLRDYRLRAGTIVVERPTIHRKLLDLALRSHLSFTHRLRLALPQGRHAGGPSCLDALLCALGPLENCGFSAFSRSSTLAGVGNEWRRVWRPFLDVCGQVVL